MSIEEFLREWRDDSPTVLVHTSGSTGAPKPMHVEKRRMEASARMTCRFLQLHPGDTALLCLPLDYIAGKMMVVRALVGRLRLLSVPPSGHPLAATAATGQAPPDFAAMVPMQVYNSLQEPAERERLMAVRHLIIGGGAVDDGLARTLRQFPNAVWSTYGMTETLSHIAMRRLSGPAASPWYTPLPGVTVAVTDGQCLTIDAPAVHAGRLVTNDIAELRPDGRFRILGRRDNIICTGGLKIQAEEVERLLQPHLAAPLLVSHRPDAKYGQAVVLLTEGDAAEAELVCRRVLPRYWQPRACVHVDHIPLTATGKPARSEARAMAAAAQPGNQGTARGTATKKAPSSAGESQSQS